MLAVAPAPSTCRLPGCGFLRTGERVKFVRSRPGSFAWRTLKIGECYEVASCEADDYANLWLRFAEHPGFAFRRTMFDLVA